MSNEKQTPKKVNLRERVSVFATEKHGFHKAGKEFKPGVVLAEYLIETGKATQTAPKAKA